MHDDTVTSSFDRASSTSYVESSTSRDAEAYSQNVATWYCSSLFDLLLSAPTSSRMSTEKRRSVLLVMSSQALQRRERALFIIKEEGFNSTPSRRTSIPRDVIDLGEEVLTTQAHISQIIRLQTAKTAQAPQTHDLQPIMLVEKGMMRAQLLRRTLAPYEGRMDRF